MSLSNQILKVVKLADTTITPKIALGNSEERGKTSQRVRIRKSLYKCVKLNPRIKLTTTLKISRLLYPKVFPYPINSTRTKKNHPPIWHIQYRLALVINSAKLIIKTISALDLTLEEKERSYGVKKRDKIKKIKSKSWKPPYKTKKAVG